MMAFPLLDETTAPECAGKGNAADTFDVPMCRISRRAWGRYQKEAHERVVSLGIPGLVTWNMQSCRSVHFVAATFECGIRMRERILGGAVRIHDTLF